MVFSSYHGNDNFFKVELDTQVDPFWNGTPFSVDQVSLYYDLSKQWHIPSIENVVPCTQTDTQLIKHVHASQVSTHLNNYEGVYLKLSSVTPSWSGLRLCGSSLYLSLSFKCLSIPVITTASPAHRRLLTLCPPTEITDISDICLLRRLCERLILLMQSTVCVCGWLCILPVMGYTL